MTGISSGSGLQVVVFLKCTETRQPIAAPRFKSYNPATLHLRRDESSLAGQIRGGTMKVLSKNLEDAPQFAVLNAPIAFQLAGTVGVPALVGVIVIS